MSFLFHDFVAARDALQSGAPFARVELGLSSQERGYLNRAMDEIYQAKLYASLLDKLYTPETLEGKALKLSYELVRKANLDGYIEGALFNFIRRVIFESSEIFSLKGDMTIRSCYSQELSKHFHTDSAPPASETGQYFLLVTLGDAPGTEFVSPGAISDTLSQLERIASIRGQVVLSACQEVNAGRWRGPLVSHPLIEGLGIECDNAVPPEEIIRAASYEVCIVRHSDYLCFGSPGATWHRAPARDTAEPRGLISIDAGVLC